ncbi:hypothetical protein [Chondromyces apiculatus]|uniref:Uncharacterized protein n=1 Tax=Chondromyces apiculatus DSM 436 TaxID=1192034 RepID=A0A017SY73_9BACT|nr:hypothetical protein [Chondromyces apiculatus]EYF01251.1 Hypothetical protein CAP_8504 [Chondromyces apiculatus DSM 436]
MKTTLRTMVLAAAGVLGTAAIAQAQQPAAPAPAPSPAPAAPAAPSAPSATTPASGAQVAAGAQGAAAPGQAGAVAGQVGAQDAPPASEQPPPPPPPTLPPTETPPATEQVTPPTPPAPVQASAPGAASPVVEEPKSPPPLRWAGTLLNWNHSATTSIFGVGQEMIGSDAEAYTWAFTFVPGYMIYRDPVNQLRVSSSLTLRWDLTNSDFSTRERDVDLNDIPLRLAYTRTLYSGGGAGEGAAAAGAAAARDPTLAGGGEYKTWGIASGGFDLPTSRWSRYQGRYLATSLGVGVRQMVKLLGSNADGLNNIIFTLSETWQHQFNRASTATNPDLQRPRQDAGGSTGISDQLTGGALVQNQLITGFSFFMPIYGNLQLNGLAQLWSQFPASFESASCEAQTLTGCVQGSRMEDRTSYRALTVFDVSLAYQVLPELLVDVGYNNTSFQLGEDGQRRNVFFSPVGSTFYADITLTLDQLYKRLSSPPEQPKVGRVVQR